MQSDEETGDGMTASSVCFRVKFRRVLIFIISILMSAPGTAIALSQQAPDTDTRLEQLYSQAQEAQSRGDYRDAAEKYAEILKLRPDLAEVRANLGLMHHLLGEYPEAVRDFEASLRSKPQLFVPNLFLGLDLLRLQQPQHALTYLERAQRLNPKDVQPVLGLGQAYAELHEFKKANYWYGRACEINPGSTEAWYGQGVTYLHLAQLAAEQLGKMGQTSVYARRLYAESLDARGWTKDAVTAYQKLFALPSAPSCSHAALGFAYLLQGDSSGFTEATTQFAEALKGNPGCLLARLGMARADIQRGNISTAMEQLAEAWKADPNFVKVNASRLWLGFEPARLEDFERRIRELPSSQPNRALTSFLITAIEKWRQEPIDTGIWAIEPTNGKGAGAPALTTSDQKQTTPAQLYSQGHYTNCSQRLRPRLAELSPSDLLLLAECAYDSGDYRSSFEAGAMLLKVNPQSLPALYWQAKASQKLAVAALVRVGLAEPNSARVHLLVAEAFREVHSPKEAEAEYKKALELEPDYVAAHLGLAIVYWRDRKYKEALPHLQSVLTLRPGDPEASYFLGAILVDRHQYAEAMPYLTAALAGTPAILPHVHEQRSRVYAAQGQTAAALAELKQSLDADADGSYHYELYQLYKKLGDEPAAAAALQKSESLRKREDMRVGGFLRESP
jgi:tetratricopeptide (TPR) repeat protein